ncbi:MAG: DUF1549 domain-containing protein, partial [Bryobacteraceae bacterium]
MRLALVFCVCLLAGGALIAADGKRAPKPTKTKASDLSEMSSDVHAPLLRKADPAQPGRLTERLTAGVPAASAQGVAARRNFIDNYIFGRMDRDGVPHAPLASDQEFLRRVRLDVTGRIPSPEETREFLADNSPDKRARLIDRLVGSPEFVDKWAYFFMDILRANGKMGRGHFLFHYTLKQSLAADRPYNDWAASLIAASAKSNYVVAAANPIVREHVEGKPGEEENGDSLKKIHQADTHDELTILFGKIFLGINLSCISCHDGQGHLEKVNVYLSTRKRSDFAQQAAFFGNVRYIAHVEGANNDEKPSATMGHFIVDDLAAGYNSEAESMLRPKRFGGPATPKFILTNKTPEPGEEPRAQLARMLTSHPQFARAAVNMFWAKLMGVGIVHPYDDFDLARQDPNNLPEGWNLQPSHPELLDELANYFRGNNYSIQKLFKLICNSSAYQLSARFPGEWRDNYAPYYARKFARMLSAEELHDAIASATERPGRFETRAPREDGSGSGAGTVGMAMQVSVPNPKGDLKSFMQAFGES